MKRGLVALLLAVALAACQSRPAAPADAAVEAADASVDAEDLDAQADAGPWAGTGALMVRVRHVRPEQVCDLGPCNVFMPGPTVLRTRSGVGGIELRAGEVESVSDGGVAAGFADQLTPTAVSAEVGSPYEGDGGPRRPFATVGPASWAIDLVPGQPALPVRNAVIRGSLDPAGVPTSNDPPMDGRIEGCFTPDDARQVNIPELSQTLLELLQSSGYSTDVDCTGSHTLDGFSFEAWFEGQAVEVHE